MYTFFHHLPIRKNFVLHPLHYNKLIYTQFFHNTLAIIAVFCCVVSSLCGSSRQRFGVKKVSSKCRVACCVFLLLLTVAIATGLGLGLGLGLRSKDTATETLVDAIKTDNLMLHLQVGREGGEERDYRLKCMLNEYIS